MLTHVRDQVETGAAGHLEVGEEQRHRLTGEEVSRFLRALGRHAVVPAVLEQPPNELADPPVVVDDQDAVAHAIAWRGSSRMRRTVSSNCEGVKGFCKKSAPDDTMSTSSALSI